MALYSEALLKDHLRFGSKVAEGAFVQHQRCTLCFGNVDRKAIKTSVLPKHYFFESEALAVHARKHHYSCYLCTDDCWTFYRTTDALNEHLEEEHTVCPLCKRAGRDAYEERTTTDGPSILLAFASVAELRRHVNAEHPVESLAAASTSATTFAAAADDTDTTSSKKHSKKSSKKRHEPLSSASINFEELERREIEKKRMALVSGKARDKVEGVQTNASARNRLDEALRQRYTAEQQANPPSFGKPGDASSEKYVVHFPTIEPGAKLPPSSLPFDLSSAVYTAQRAPDTQSSNPSFPALPRASDGRCAPAGMRISVNSSWQKNKYLEHRRPIVTATLNAATAPLGFSVPVPSTRDVIKRTKKELGMETSSSESPSSQDLSSPSASVDVSAADAAEGSKGGPSSGWPSMVSTSTMSQSESMPTNVKRTPPGIRLSPTQLHVNRQQAWLAAVKTGPSASSSAAPPAHQQIPFTRCTFQDAEEFPSLGPPRPGPSSGGDSAKQGAKPSLAKQQQQQQTKSSKKAFFDRFKKL